MLHNCEHIGAVPPLGDIWNGVTNTEAQEEFRFCNAYARPDCNDCWAKLYCSGGCAANAYHATGDVKGIYEYGCELFRKRMECAIMIQVAHDAEGIVPKKASSTDSQATDANINADSDSKASVDCSDDTDCNNCASNDTEDLRRC